ncbi:scp-like extracellular, putative [Ichthyophthirius multifiliis]|uniref:Scp-like extracellular, putative n=1 Tax=Ichthyophthirius multifiliis TaxID=5932 RepID=G0QS77_ICHMU|nr:scp-like extracellular, putative [Ichthyophthirius multifiliis]EGR31942.1 scp-like extracellular, putative [Ichthyophthirius multifiliis]|eukprot:XP_004035428.1 scp-like extracellular, putative [Ichthyophthirius multifiliis]
MDQLALQVFNEQNKIRQNPKSYIGNLERMLGFFKGNTLYLPGQIPLQTNEGPSAVRDCMNFLNRQQSLEPLKLNDQMSKAAQDHANDIGPKGITGHNGSDGSTMTSRLEKYGDWMGKIGENICFGGNTAVDIIVQLIIDDGVSNRGHRMNIFGKDYKVTGIAAAKHSQYDICCVLDYASEYTSKGNKCQLQLTLIQGDLGLQFQDQLKDFDNFFKKDPQQDQFTGNNQKPPGTVKTSTEKKINIVNGVRTVTETITYTLANGEVKVVEKVYQQ